MLPMNWFRKSNYCFKMLHNSFKKNILHPLGTLILFYDLILNLILNFN
jgi:hypothetical protein